MSFAVLWFSGGYFPLKKQTTSASDFVAVKVSALSQMLENVTVRATPAPSLDISLGNAGIYFSCPVLTHGNSSCGQSGSTCKFVTLDT